MIKFASRLRSSGPKNAQAREDIRISWRSARHPEVFIEVYDDMVRAGNALKSLERCSNSVVLSVNWVSRPEFGDANSAKAGLLLQRD
jgi:hypothetical protein